MDIEIRDLHYTYPGGIDALHGVNLTIPSGARIALLGQNGAGKSTLIKHLNGLNKPTQGSVHIGDWDTRQHTIAQLAARVGLVFQNPDDQLFKTQVAEEVAFGPTNLKCSPDDIKRRVDHALQLCGLEQVRATHPYDLQLWQRRWVAIASVIAIETPIVVLDEPTTGQDAFGLTRLAALLDSLHAAGVTVIAVTHDIDYAVEHFTELVVMAQGQVIAHGDAQILADAQIVQQSALNAPQVMRLANALGWQSSPATPEAFLSALPRRVFRG